MPDIRVVFWVAACVVVGSQQAALCADAVKASEPVPLSRVVDYEPAWSPDGGRITFVSNRNGSFKVYSMKDDGSELKQLTQGTAEDDAPAWSPDGSRIAYVSTQDGNSEIYVMRADGTNATRLTRDDGIDIHPNWSPDGSSILWNSSRNSHNKAEPEAFELYTMKPDGSDVRQRTRGGVSTYASWSPDGRRIVLRKQLPDGNSDVFVTNADGSGERNVTRSPAFEGWPAWSRDGKSIVFAREQSEDSATIHVVNVDGSGERALVTLPGRNTNPRWSPTHDRLLFSRRADRQIRLYVLDLSPR